jgi:heme/copper-type cytochrome/quinol oxidase subunit 2
MIMIVFKILFILISVIALGAFIFMFYCIFRGLKALGDDNTTEERKWDRKVTLSGMSIMGLGALMILVGFFQWLLT